MRPVFCADCLKLFKEGKLKREDFIKISSDPKPKTDNNLKEEDNKNNNVKVLKPRTKIMQLKTKKMLILKIKKY